MSKDLLYSRRQNGLLSRFQSWSIIHLLRFWFVISTNIGCWPFHSTLAFLRSVGRLENTACLNIGQEYTISRNTRTSFVEDTQALQIHAPMKYLFLSLDYDFRAYGRWWLPALRALWMNECGCMGSCIGDTDQIEFTITRIWFDPWWEFHSDIFHLSGFHFTFSNCIYILFCAYDPYLIALSVHPVCAPQPSNANRAKCSAHRSKFQAANCDKCVCVCA